MNEQIEGMAKVICDLCKGRGGCGREDKPCDALLKDAEALYNAGYRKQKDGEWITRPYKFREFRYECSACGGGADLKTRYCPNCGARMKGGAE